MFHRTVFKALVSYMIMTMNILVENAMKVSQSEIPMSVGGSY